MKDMHYQTRTFRLADEIYEELKRRKPKELSWNLYFFRLLCPEAKKGTMKKMIEKGEL